MCIRDRNGIEASPLAAFDHPLIRGRITDALNGREVTEAVTYTHLRAHETPEQLVCRPLLEKKKKN